MGKGGFKICLLENYCSCYPLILPHANNCTEGLDSPRTRSNEIWWQRTGIMISVVQYLYLSPHLHPLPPSLPLLPPSPPCLTHLHRHLHPYPIPIPLLYPSPSPSLTSISPPSPSLTCIPHPIATSLSHTYIRCLCPNNHTTVIEDLHSSRTVSDEI